MKTKTIHLCKRGLALLLAVALCISILPGMAIAVEAATPSKTISASIKFYNHTGKRITELYFEDSNAEDYFKTKNSAKVTSVKLNKISFSLT